jgi:hypothetical protein
MPKYLREIVAFPDQAAWWKSLTPKQQQLYLRKHKSKKHQNAALRLKKPKIPTPSRAHATSVEAGKVFQKLSESMWALCRKNNWGDPFTYGRHREIDMAIKMGHSIGEGQKGGADGYDQNNRPVEYKATIGSSLQGTYNGISVQNTLKKQRQYILKEKIGNYHKHFIARYDGPNIAEIWSIPGEKVVEILWPKIKSQYLNVVARKDPRIGVSLTGKEIRTYGHQLKFNPTKEIYE